MYREPMTLQLLRQPKLRQRLLRLRRRRRLLPPLKPHGPPQAARPLPGRLVMHRLFPAVYRTRLLTPSR
jgi:hypothetical protein